MSIISNCASAGADSRAAAITGAVTRKDKVTGQEVPATVRPNGVAPSEGVAAMSGGASLASSVLSVLLEAQEV